MKFNTPIKILAICIFSYDVDAAVITNVAGVTGLWSDTSTWVNNTLPQMNDDVIISGMEAKVTLDVMNPPLLNSITVKMGATLEVQDPTIGEQMTLELYHLHVLHHASLVIGMPDNRIQGNVLIRLHGDGSTPVLNEDHASSGSKVLFNHNGNVDIHGAERSHTWTRLSATAEEGSTILRVRGWVDWKVGEKIAITSSDFDVDGFQEQLEAQEVMIMETTQETSASGEEETVLTVSDAMNYTHWGELQCWDDDDGEEYCVDTAAEVALLSRNIVVEGNMDTSSVDDSFGAQMKFHNSEFGLSRISYVETRDMGQRVLGSYPIHFHVPGNSEGSYAIGNSIHRSFNRGITIHGAQGLYVGNNVVYDTFGHAIYLEDGTEMGNTIEGNLVFNTHAQDEDLLDAEDRTPASYWISNPNNTIINNVAGGGRYSGFWIVPEKTLDVESDLCPRHIPLGEFRNNTAHSYFKYGIELTRWLPKIANSPCSNDSEDEPAVLVNNTVFKNGYNGVRFVGSSGGCGAIVLDGLVAVDNARTYHTSAAVYWSSVSDSVQKTGSVGVRNAIFIQWSNNNPFSKENVLSNPVRAALKFPDNSDNVFVESSIFVNYYQEGWVFDPERQSGQHDANDNGFEIPTRELKFINSPNRVHFRFPHHGIVIDQDGSITGSPSRIVAASPLYDMNRCSVAPPNIATTLANNDTFVEYDKVVHSVDLLVCDIDYTLRRLGMGEFVDGDDEQALQTFENEGNEEAILGWGSQGRYTVVAPTNTTINVKFDRGYAPKEWSQQLSRRYMDSHEFIHFVFHPPASKDFSTFNVQFDGSDAPVDAFFTDGNALHVNFDANFIELKDLTYADTGPTTSPPTKAPSTPSPTSPPSTANPTTKQPTQAPNTLAAIGEPCTRGSDCVSPGICGSNGGDNVVCVEDYAHLFCR